VSGLACFLAPLALAAVVTALQRTFKRASKRLMLWVLSTMLWGGSLLLVLEHAWHGEVVPWPPFLTAMQSPSDIPVVINEVLTVGMSMNAAVTLAWLGVLWFSRVRYGGLAYLRLGVLRRG